MQLNINTTVRTLSALVAGIAEAKRDAARVLAYAALTVAFDCEDALDELISLDLDGLESNLDREIDRDATAEARRDAYVLFTQKFANADHAFDTLNALWMSGTTKDGNPRQSPLSRRQFTGSGMPTADEVDALMDEVTA